MIRFLRNLGYYAKALEALLGTLLLFSTLMLTINGWLPAELAKQVGVGLVAGVYPAGRAAKLAPIDALRHE